MVRNYVRTTGNNFTKKELIGTLKKVRNNTWTIDEALKRTNISRATLYRHLKREDDEDSSLIDKRTLRQAKKYRRPGDLSSDDESDNSGESNEDLRTSSSSTESSDSGVEKSVQHYKPRKITKKVELARSRLRNLVQVKKDKKLVVSLERISTSKPNSAKNINEEEKKKRTSTRSRN